MPSWSLDELFAVLLARDLRASDRTIQVGANMPAARAAALMANLTTLPNARIYMGFAIDSVRLGGGKESAPVHELLFDPRTLCHGEARMVQAEVFDDMATPDVFFVAGLQVDRRGNVNLLGIPKVEGGWKARGPGAVALATMSTHCRGYYIVMPHHDPRVFVERVAFITALGDRNRRAALSLPGGGPRLVLSPLGVFDFDELGDMRLLTAHPGVLSEQLAEATGFDMRLPADLRETVPPSDEELSFLRTYVDPVGLLRQRGLFRPR